MKIMGHHLMKGLLQTIGLLWAVPAMASVMSGGGYEMRQGIVTGGGGASESAGYRVMGTIGQPLVGESFYGDRIGINGFWHKDTIDDLPPVVVASIPGGMYTSAQSVDIICSDGGGSGCIAVYYTTDGSNPTVSSTLYTGALSLSTDRTVRFIGVDLAGNVSGVSGETYAFDLDGDRLRDSWEVANLGSTTGSASSDTDHDGFTDLQEYLLGSDPNTDNADMADSDGDGVPDVVEIASGSDPDRYDLFEDIDGDGLSNGEEYLLATSASTDNGTLADSDADGIPDMVEIIAGLSGNNSTSDKDGDGISDLVEYKNGTLYVSNAALDDSDNDGLPDLWEMANGLDPLKDDSAAYGALYASGSVPMAGNLPPTPVVVTAINGTRHPLGDTVTIPFLPSTDPEGSAVTYMATLVEGLGVGGAAVDGPVSVTTGSGYTPSLMGGFKTDTIYTAIIKANDGNADSPATLVSFVISSGTIEGDISYSGKVDGHDLVFLSVAFGKRSTHRTFNPFADIVADKIIDGLDLNKLAPNFGKGRP